MNKYKNKFEICVRAVIRHNGRILVCRFLGKKYYFFPGGHIEYGETAVEALKRELREELGVEAKKCAFIGTIENIYGEDGEKHHEINLVFDVSVDGIHNQSREDHIDFAFLDKKEFAKEKVLPIAMQKSVIKWLKDKKIFGATQ